MKNIIRKISVIMIALMLMLGAVINTNVKSIYADEYTDNNIITVKFVFAKADHKFEDYYMLAFLNSQEMGTKGEFMIIDDVAVFKCEFKKNLDVDQIIAYRVMEKELNKAYMSGEIDITGFNSGHVEVTINGDRGTAEIKGEGVNVNINEQETPSTGEQETPSTGEQETPSTGEQETPSTGEQETPSTGEQESSSEESGNVHINQQINKPKGDDPNADYSVKPGMVILIDVLFFGALGACAYYVLSKKKNAFM